VGLKDPGQMKSPCETYVSMRRSTFHSSVASSFRVTCLKLRLTLLIPMTSRDVSRSRSHGVQRRPGTFFLVTRDKGVNQD